jgi:hypothetical protein
MTSLRRPPHLDFARPGANSTLELTEYIRSILRNSEQPVSRNEILMALAAWSHATNRQSLNVVIEFLEANGLVAEGEKGLIWVHEASARLARIIEDRRDL